jgi:signal peptidase I
MNTLISIFLILLSLVSGSSTQKVYVNDGPSMTPTINNGDKMIVNLDISKGIFKDDIIIFKTEEKSFRKRVIGLEGDKIEIKDSGIFVNNKLMYKTRIGDNLIKPQITLKKDEFYVIGDNVDNSYDSRFYGPINQEQIIGKVTKIQHIQ